jgi:hypothetical protein
LNLNKIIKKTNLLERLEFFLLNPDRVKEYQLEAEKREIETRTEPYSFGPTAPSGISTSEEDEYMRLRQAVEGYEDQEDEEDGRDNDFSSSGLEGLSQFKGLSSYDGSALYDPNAPRTASDDGGDDYDRDSSDNIRPTPSSRNDLNSNIMKLEEKVNRLSKLTKGINSF